MWYAFGMTSEPIPLLSAPPRRPPRVWPDIFIFVAYTVGLVNVATAPAPWSWLSFAACLLLFLIYAFLIVGLRRLFHEIRESVRGACGAKPLGDLVGLTPTGDNPNHWSTREDPK